MTIRETETASEWLRWMLCAMTSDVCPVCVAKRHLCLCLRGGVLDLDQNALVESKLSDDLYLALYAGKAR
jgi:hypothetical protein